MANVLIVTILSLFVMDAFPLEDIHDLAPTFLKPAVSQVGEWHAGLYDYIDVPLHFLGLQQGVWNMYTGDYPDSSNCYLHAKLHYDNATTVPWDSPDWITMPWWERKMKMRLMNYYDSFEMSTAAASWVAFAKRLQQQYSTTTQDNAAAESSVSTVTTVDLYLRCEYGIEYPETIGWWEPIRQPMEEDLSLLVTVDVCADDFSECHDWKEQGLCTAYSKGMRLYCQQTCEICDDYIITWPTRVSPIVFCFFQGILS
jgi:hypothetical protein